MRTYSTYSKMLHNKYQDKIGQPDLNHVNTLHQLLDLVQDDNLAMMIDRVVADLIRCNNPPSGVPLEALPPEILPR